MGNRFLGVLVVFTVLSLLSTSPLAGCVVHSDTSSLRAGPLVDKINYKLMPGDDSQVLALLDDEVDLIGDMIDPTYLDSLIEAEDIEVANVLRNGYGRILINCAKYPFNITAFRRALAFALDKEAISDYVWEGLSVPQDSCVPQINPFSIEGQLDYSYYVAEISMGKQLLDGAGFLDVDEDGIREAPDGSEFDVLIEVPYSSNIAMEIGEYVEGALVELGINANSEPTDFYDYLNRLYFHGDFDIVYLGKSFSSLDVDWLAYEYWSEYADEPYWNFPNWRNTTYDSWRDQLLHSTEYDDVYEAAIEMQRVWVHACPEIVCYENVLLSAFRTDRFENHINDVNEGVPSFWTSMQVHLNPSEGGPLGGTLRWSTPIDIATFNFMVVAGAYAYLPPLKMLWDSLFRQGPDGTDIPWLAHSFTVETHEDDVAVPEGHTRFKFNVLDNVTWSDGTPLTAEDVAFTFNYYRDSPGNPYGFYLSEMTAAYSPTPTSVVVVFETESYWHLHNIAYSPIIPKHIFTEIGLDDWNLWDPDPFRPNETGFVTTGPFLVSNYSAGEFTELSRNPDYFIGRPQLTSTTTSSTSPSTLPSELPSIPLVHAFITIPSLVVILIVLVKWKGEV